MFGGVYHDRRSADSEPLRLNAFRVSATRNSFHFTTGKRSASDKHRMLAGRILYVCVMLLACSPVAFTGCRTTKPAKPTHIEADAAKVRLGMSKAEVINILGAPLRQSIVVDDSGTTEKYLYRESQRRSVTESASAALRDGGAHPSPEPALQLTFRNGRLKALQAAY